MAGSGGGGQVRFFGISGFPRKSGVSTVTGGYHHGHKLVARETGVSLESLSEVYARKKSTSRWSCGLFASFAITKTAPATCLDQQSVQFSSSGTSKKKNPKSTPGAAVLYIRGARVRWGRRRERRETRKFSGLDSPGGTSGASKSDSFPVCVRFLSRNVRRTVAPRPATPPRMSRFGRFGGGGSSTFFWYFWVPEKIRGEHRHRGVPPWT